MNFDKAEILKNCIHRIYREGLTTASGGNISCRQGENILISPSQIDKGFLSSDDFALIDFHGRSLNAKEASMESPFHLEIYKTFPEVEAVCHIHAPVLVALSILKPDEEYLDLLKKYYCTFAEYAVPGSMELGNNIITALTKTPQVVIMQNHGVIAVGKTIDEATDKIRLLDEKMRIHFAINTSVLDSFDLEFKSTIEFYKERSKHFLSLSTGIEFLESKNEYSSEFELNSVNHMNKNDLGLLNRIIPESYLILKEPRFSDFDEINFPILINAARKIKVKARTLYELYDRMEVLDFSAKVILFACQMGSINPLSEDQIQELKNKFKS